MSKTFKLALLLCLLTMSMGSFAKKKVQQPVAQRWTVEKANAWYASKPWLRGCNYIPANAINQIEMWSRDTYDAKQIDKELTWAQELGFNTMRVFLSSVVYANDPDGMKQRMDNFLSICQKHGIQPLFVFFDDCWNPEATYGKQPEPKTGIHNSGWLRDPSMSLRKDTVKLYQSLSTYVKDILTTFGKDERILLWDLYNEPGNNGLTTQSLPLLRKVFEWARQANPSQPVTACVWNTAADFQPLNKFVLDNSDVISYHNYSPQASHRDEIDYLSICGRPLVCTEYMARKQGSTFSSIMPLLKERKVVAINWGFVAGKTNTIYAWSTPMPQGGEPELWFHDILRPDGSPFSQDEVDFIKKINGVIK